jgi:sigma-B regulation protein RsbU (phosphoserine phosphatase)
LRLRAQLALAFFLLAVVPLLGVTLYSYQASEGTFRRAVAAEAETLAATMSTRVEAVADELNERLTRMRRVVPAGEAETAFQKARREALEAAEKEELRLWLRSILSGVERRAGAIPFAIDPEGRVFAPGPQDEQTILALGLVPGRAPTRRDAAEWVVPFRSDPQTGIVIGVARPVGPALQDFRRTAGRNLGLGLGLALLAALGILPLSHRMTRHLAALTDGAERLARGDLAVRVPVPHGREFARLAQTFNRMAGELRANQDRLIEQERLRKELEIGRRIQEELLPRGPLRAPFAEMSGVSVPAREVGGDFFNYFAVGEGEVAILIGDVSGKGVGAALLMANLQATIRARLGLERDLAGLVDRLDRDMSSDQPLAPYYTLFLAVLDGSSGALRYVNAGHNTQFVLRRHRGVDRLASTGRPPGLYPGGGYEERSLRLEEGDALFLFTDGLVEAEDETEEPFGMARLEALLQVHREEGLAELLARVHAAVALHRGPVEAADDATMVALRFSDGGLEGPSA